MGRKSSDKRITEDGRIVETITPIHNTGDNILNLIKYIGGKVKLTPTFEQYFPNPKTYKIITFVDVFGGSGAVTLNKSTVYKVEVINDISTDIVNLYAVIKSKYDEFVNKLESLLYGRTTFEFLKAELEKPFRFNPFEPDVNRAVAVFYVYNASFSGMGDSYSASKATNTAKIYFNKVEKLVNVYDKFKNVQIENLDFEQLIDKYDSENTFFYADPPYFGTEFYYSGGFSYDDHVRLLNKLNNIKGYYMLSGYDNDLYNSILNYKYKVEVKTKKWSGSAIDDEDGSITRNDAVEILWLNYDKFLSAKTDDKVTLFDM